MAEELRRFDPNELVIVGFDTDDRMEHPLYDERAFLDVEDPFVRSIRTYGVQVPLLVREEAGTFYVVDGRQRVKAARLVFAEQSKSGEVPLKVPARVVTVSEKRASSLVVLTNENRRGDDVLTKAIKAERLMERLGDEDEVATVFGVTPNTIRNWLTLVQADPFVHEAIREGKISAYAGVELAGLPKEEQKEALEKLLFGGETVSRKAVAIKKKEEGVTRGHKGVRRSWVEKALKTEAAKKLNDEQRSILQWFATGESNKGDWFEDFTWEVGVELEAPKKGKKSSQEPQQGDDSEE
jgi:ParB family chromosome partitioning protein